MDSMDDRLRPMPLWTPPISTGLVGGGLLGYVAGSDVWAVLLGAAVGLLLWCAWVIVTGLCWSAGREVRDEDEY